MGPVRCCLLCLGTQVKMYQMNASMLTIYNELLLTTCKLSIPLSKHMHACYECAYLLQKYGEFKTKCCKAYNILCSLSPKPFEVTEEILKSIDRKQNKLVSPLTRSTTTSDYHKQQDCDSDEQFGAPKVKIESSVNIQEQCNDNPFYSVEKLTVPVIFTTSISNNEIIINGQSEMYRECKPDVKSSFEYNTQDGYHSSNHSNLNESSGIERTLETPIDYSEVESVDNKNDLASEIKLDADYSDSDRDPVILDKHPVELKTVNKKENTVKTRKRKCVALNKYIKKTKTRSEGSTKGLTRKKRPERNGNKIIEVLNKKKNTPTKKKEDRRITLDSGFFKDRMTIVSLTIEDARRELLLRKESRNYKTTSHKCDLCYRGFISEATYEAHLKKHSLEHGTIKCDICQFSFFDKRALTRHWIKCHTWKLLCKTCPYICYCINQAKSHIQSHEGKKYTCKDCDAVFRFPNSLATHVRSKHSIEVVCDFCGSTFASAQGLECHKRLRHRKEKNGFAGPQCAECDVHFASELAWKRHLVLCSRHQVQNGCEVCGETFPDREELRSHSLEHGTRKGTSTTRSRTRKVIDKSDIKPMPCKICKKELYGRNAYVKHMNKEHPETIKTPKYKSCVCEVCGRFFKHNSFLVAHQRTHTDEKPFSCPQCGKRFKNAYTVKMHLPIHTNEYRYKCELCEKAFSDRGRLNRHIKGHLGIRPYKCAYCDKSFLYQCEEKLHTKYVHCKEPYPKRDRRKNSAVKRESLN